MFRSQLLNENAASLRSVGISSGTATVNVTVKKALERFARWHQQSAAVSDEGRHVTFTGGEVYALIGSSAPHVVYALLDHEHAPGSIAEITLRCEVVGNFGAGAGVMLGMESTFFEPL